MTHILQSLSEIASDYDAVLCDVWGCYHNGIAPYPAAVAALQAYRAQGGTAILLTNAPRPAPAVQGLLDKMGAPRDSYDAIVSSGGACQAALASGDYGDRIHYVGPGRDHMMLSDINLEPVAEDQATAILITGLRDDQTETPETYAPEIARWAERGLPMLCANPDRLVDRGDQRLWCAGAVAEAYENAGGRVIWFGKPYLPVYDRCYQVLRDLTGAVVPKPRILAIGDGTLTDVPGGIAAGLDTVFVTGGLADGAFGPDPEHPQKDALEAFLVEHALTPKFAIGRLR